MEGVEVVQLPSESGDEATARCRLGVELMNRLNAHVGDAVLICDGQDAYVCSCWPGSWTQDNLIQYSCMVRQSKELQLKKLSLKATSTPRKISLEIMKHSRINEISVCVVLTNFMDVSSAKQMSHSIGSHLSQNIHRLLRGFYFTNNVDIDFRQHPLGKLYGVSYVLVQDFSEKFACAKIGKDSRISIKSVLSCERYESRYSQRATHIGGLDSVKAKLKEIVQFSVNNSHSIRTGGVCWPHGVLLRGPSGCGKTDLVKQIAHELQAFLYIINGAEVIGAHPGKSEGNLREIFQKMTVISEEGPCILFLDDVEALCPRRGRGSGGPGNRLTSQLGSLLDGLQQNTPLVVIAATNKAHILDPLIRRPGRLEKEVFIGVPSQEERAAILKALTRRLSVVIQEDDLVWLASATPGFVGADLLSLLQQGLLAALQGQTEKTLPSTLLRSHLEKALHLVVPSSQRGGDVRVDHAPVKWEQIGGLQDIKQQIQQAVQWPLKHPDAFTRLGLRPPQGVLLYGPPGCAKTMLVRAAATACHVNFLAVSGAQLYSPFVGDSERKLTQVFQQARAGAPSILFMDELDAVVGKRGGSGRQGGAHERVLTTLLNEMDGIGIQVDQLVTSSQKEAEGEESVTTQTTKKERSVPPCGVLFVAATNRPDLIDAALTRPGRIDRIIYVPPPDRQARQEILRVHTKDMPLEDVDLGSLAEHTEGFTGADLENLCREAALHALSVDGIHAAIVRQGHFEVTLAGLKPSLTTQQLQEYEHYKWRQ